MKTPTAMTDEAREWLASMSPTAQFYDHLRTLRDDNADLVKERDDLRSGENVACAERDGWRSRAEAAEAQVAALTARLGTAVEALLSWIDYNDNDRRSTREMIAVYDKILGATRRAAQQTEGGE